MIKVQCADVHLHNDGYYYMFYIGVDGDQHASIHLVRSRDGISQWEKYLGNPIVAGTDGGWDYICVFRPALLEVADGYWLYYNAAFYPDRDAREGGKASEAIGRAVRQGFALWSEKGAERERRMSAYKGRLNWM